MIKMAVAAGAAAFAVALASMLCLQPEEGQVGRFGILVVYRGSDKRCVHVHHWLTFSLLSFFLLLGAWCSGQLQPTARLLVVLGLLLGVAVSGAAYSDSWSLLPPCPG